MSEDQNVNKEKANLYGSVFNNKHGNEVLNDLLNFSGFYADTFVPNDPYSTAYAAGPTKSIASHLEFPQQEQRNLLMSERKWKLYSYH